MLISCENLLFSSAPMPYPTMSQSASMHSAAIRSRLSLSSCISHCSCIASTCACWSTVSRKTSPTCKSTWDSTLTRNGTASRYSHSLLASNNSKTHCRLSKSLSCPIHSTKTLRNVHIKKVSVSISKQDKVIENIVFEFIVVYVLCDCLIQYSDLERRQ